MKVIHIAHAPLFDGHPDHASMTLHPGRWALNLAIAQRRFVGLETYFVTQVPGSSADCTLMVADVPVHYLKAPDRLRAATLFHFDAKRIAAKVLSLKPDIVHAHGTEDACSLAAIATGKPFLITAQGCYFILNRELPPKLISRSRVLEFTERLALRRTRHVIAKSAYVKAELGREFPQLKLHKIPNTIDPDLLSISVDGVRRAGHIAFVGTVVDRKGVHILRQALQTMEANTAPLKPVLHIFGNRPNVSADSYEGRELVALQSMLGERLILHGTIPSLEVAKELATIPLLVAPSLEEMFGNQFIEALVVGTEAVVTEGTAMAENARRFQAGRIIPQNDPSALASAIQSALAGPRNAEETLQIRDRVLSHVGPEAVSLQHLKLYEQILHDR